MKNLEFFMKKIELIELKYKNINEISVDQFNIFSILRKSSDEVNLHSRFIFELLNPKGTHNQGETFLKLFFDEISISLPFDKIEVYREKENIDILLLSNESSIIIENKIYTEDHSNQLSTYLSTIEKKGYLKENIRVIYLTLFGSEPNEILMKNKTINLSYEVDILKWLELCIKEVSLIPVLRETINQYYSLVKKLTNQHHNKGFIMKTRDFFLSDIMNLKIALNLQESINEAKIFIQLNYWKKLQSYLNNKNLEFEFYDTNGEKDFDKAVEKYYKQQKNKRYYGLRIHLEDKLYFFIELNWHIYYGFSTFQNDKIKEREFNIINKIDTVWESKSKGLFYKFPKNRLNFEDFNNDNILDLLDEELMNKNIKDISKDIFYLLEKFNKYKH